MRSYEKKQTTYAKLSVLQCKCEKIYYLLLGRECYDRINNCTKNPAGYRAVAV